MEAIFRMMVFLGLQMILVPLLLSVIAFAWCVANPIKI